MPVPQLTAVLVALLASHAHAQTVPPAGNITCGLEGQRCCRNLPFHERCQGDLICTVDLDNPVSFFDVCSPRNPPNCGEEGVQCCRRDDDIIINCNEGLVCSGLKCAKCGAEGAPCCDVVESEDAAEGTCDDGLKCNSRLSCTKPDCGEKGAECCTGTGQSACGDGLVCGDDGERCVECGDDGQPCCPEGGVGRCGGGLACDAMTATCGAAAPDCGGQGAKCCPDDDRDGIRDCNEGLLCVGGDTCAPCGAEGAQCCDVVESENAGNGTCDGGLVCGTNLICIKKASCGVKGGACCTGAGVNACGDGLVRSGDACVECGGDGEQCCSAAGGGAATCNDPLTCNWSDPEDSVSAQVCGPPPQPDCGSRGAPCCEGGTCDADSTCTNGTCVGVAPTGPDCGSVGQDCCTKPGVDECGTGLECKGSKCVKQPACGGVGAKCCKRSGRGGDDGCKGDRVCGSGGVCKAKQIARCGWRGKKCCRGRRCASKRLTCHRGRCKPRFRPRRRCGWRGQKCCPGRKCRRKWLRCHRGRCKPRFRRRQRSRSRYHAYG